MGEHAPLRLASTTVIIRNTSGRWQVFLIKRHESFSFFGGAHVFPGGRVDACDHHFASNHPGSSAQQLAAIRETAEEIGVLIISDPLGNRPDSKNSQEILTAIRNGSPFYETIISAGFAPNAERLRPLSWWITPEIESRRYDTRFFLLEVPSDTPISIDPRESSAGAWFLPQQALAAYADDKMQLAPPTMAILELLEQTNNPKLLTQNTILVETPVCPVSATDPESQEFMLLLPGDKLYPKPLPQALPHRTRFTLKNSGLFV